MSDYYKILVTELKTDPNGLGYATLTDEQVAALLMDPTRGRKPDHTMRTMRGAIEALLAAGLDPRRAMQAISEAAAADPLIAEGVASLRSYTDSGGLDFANPLIGQTPRSRVHGDFCD